MNAIQRHFAAPSTLISRNITVNGRRTSVRLEREMWVALFNICHREQRSVNDIAGLIAGRKRSGTSMTAAIRVFVMAYFRAAATEAGHEAAGQGTGKLMAASDFWSSGKADDSRKVA
jgi:predicted DNA-binding ribbon-helix-helix protein